MPDLRKELDEARAERSRIQAESAPLRAERDVLIAKLRPLRREINLLTDQISEIEKPELFNINNEIGRLAKALGGRSIGG